MIKPFIQKYLAYLFPIVLVLAGGSTYAQNCQATTTWTLDPPPVNNEYEPGQIVEMCVTISNFIDGPAGGAWLHGITFQFPDGWDMDNVISFTPPASACGSAGTWGWYDNIFANATQQNFGPGFYFETSAGSGFVDGNPGNNWGNICTGGTWTFCIEVQLDADCGGAGNPLDGQSIVPEIFVSGDGITGGFGAPSGFASGCLTSPNFVQSPNFAIDFNCCDAESGGDPGVIDICNTTTVLYDELLDPKETGGSWTDPNGVNVGNHTFVFDPDIHPPGEYTYCVLGTDDCESCTSLTMEYINLGFLPNVVYCGTTPTSIQAIYNTQFVTFPHDYSGIWTLPDGVTTIPGNGPLNPLTSPEGVYVYSFDNAQNCPVIVSANVSFAVGGSGGPQNVTVDICQLDPLFNPLDSFAAPAPPVVPGSIWLYFSNNPPPTNFLYTWGVNNSNPNINPSNYNNCNPPPNCTPQTMISGYMTYTTGLAPCPPRTDTLIVNMYPPTDAGEFTQVNVCVTDPPFVLETLLEGTPTFGMEWTNPADPTQTFPGNILDPSAFPPNTTLLLQYSGGLSGSPCFSTNLMEIIILPADANAGDFNSISICESEAQFCMTDSLPGAQDGGVWTDPGGVVVPGCGFNPATMPSGTYTYTITTSCDTDTQDLEITVISLADAGTDGSLTLCSNDTNVPLFGGLGGTPDTPGQWTFGGVNVGPTINGNAVADGDVFTYEVGTGTCANTATVTIDLQTSPSAGVLTTVPQNYCSADAPFNLNDLFTTAPSAGTGNWTGPGGFTGNTLDPGSDLPGIYIFTLTTPNCGSVSTNITINIEATPNAGTNAVVSACPNATGNINLLTVLGADPGGSWTAPPGGPTTGTFTPGSPGGAYVYTLTSTSGNCVSTATATVNLTTLPNAGDGGSITVCATDPCFNLLPNMPGTPAGNGSWFNPGNGFFGPAGAQFCPATGTPGNYSYTVPAPGCPPVTAVLNVTVVPEPNAGTNTTLTLCENLGSIDLTSYLGGNPEAGGSWNVTNPYNISGNCGNTEVLTYEVVNGSCSSTANLTLTVECLPDAGPDTDVDLCSAGGTLNLNAILAPGAGTPGSWLNPAMAPVTTVPNVPASSGIYTYVATGNTCPDDNASYTLNIYSPITVSNIGANCNAAQTGYIATFEISGGTGNYQVNGNNIAGNTFTSGLLALVNETFIVTDDGPCAQVSVPVQAPDCNCPATASFAGGNQSICAGESVDVSINLIGDGPFTLEYSANGVDQPVLNGINNGHVISLSPAVTTTYEITAVSDANCVGSATSSIVVNVETPPNAGPNQTLELCGAAGTINLNTLLSGAADFPGNWAPANPVPNNATSTGIYTYTVEGNQCPDDVASYDITIFDPLAATNVTASCNLAQTQYTVTATITGGSGNFTATNGTIAGNVFTSIAFAAGTNYTFTITDNGSPCAPITINGPSPNCSCAATANFSGGNITICQGESATLPLVLNGVGPWQVTYSDGVTNVGPVQVNAGGGLTVTPGSTTTYNLVAVSDANCTGSASGSLTVVVDTPPNAGPNVTETLCGGPGNLNLVTLIPTGGGIPTNGTWTGPVPVTGSSVPNNAASSGIYTYQLNPNSCPADQATYDITIFNPITVSSVVTACNLAQTEYTVSFTISGGTGNYTVTGSVPGTLAGNTFTSVLIDASLGLGYDFTVSDDGPCANVLVEGDEPSCECLATGSFTGSGSVCQGSCANITFSGSGVPPFSIVYQNSNDPGNPVTLNNVFNNQTIQVCPGTNATYTLLSVTDANCNGTVTGNPVSIAVHEPIVVSNVNPTCDDSGETYTLTFNVTGGVAPFVITPAGGNFNAATGTYTSPPITSGNGYNYTVNDAGACPAVIVSGDPFTCPCTTEAGSLVNTDISACTNEIITVETDVAPELDGNDIYQFVLHDGDADNLGQVLVTSNDGTFSYNPSLQSGVTYYIVALAGNGTVQNNVNLNDPCLSISNAVAVVFNALPTASFGNNVTVCDGQEATLNLSFTGTGPWTYSYSVNGGPASDAVVSAGNNTTISVTEAGTYTISTISDANCTGLGGNQVVVSTFAVPTAAMSGDPLVCEGSGDGPTVSFTGNGPWTFEYSINGAIQPFVTTTSNPYTIPAAESGTFALTGVVDANCVGSVSGSLEVQYTALPTAQINGGGVVCAGETAAFSLNLSGSGPWTVQYAVDGVPQTPINTTQANYSFMSGAAGTYTVTTVSDQFCSGPGTEGEASLQVNPLPSGEIISSDNLVCIGQDLELTFAMQGVPPFDLTYAINGDTIQLNGIPLTYTITLNPTEPLIAEMIFAEDGSNPTCSSTLFNSTFVQVSELPNAPVLVDDTICSGEEPISIGVPAAPGLSYSWSPTSGLSNPNVANPLATLINANLTPKVFTYVVTASNDICSASDTVNITVVPRPRARFLFDPDPVYSEDPTVYFVNKSIVNDNTQFFWDFATLGASTAKNPQFKFPEGRQANYTVTLTAVDMELGCSDTFSDQINVRRELLIYVPNAFTPDGDRKNELWGPVMTNISPDDYLLTVFDRTGNIVFETRDIKQRWNGGMMNGEYYLKPDVYVWTIKGREIGVKDEFEMSGTVTLMR